jgi:hypothetical protein
LFFHPAIFIDHAGFVKHFKNLFYDVLAVNLTHANLSHPRG